MMNIRIRVGDEVIINSPRKSYEELTGIKSKVVKIHGDSKDRPEIELQNMIFVYLDEIEPATQITTENDMDRYIKQLIGVISDADFSAEEKTYITKVVSEYFSELGRKERHDKFQGVIDNIMITKYDGRSTEEIVSAIQQGWKREIDKIHSKLL